MPCGTSILIIRIAIRVAPIFFFAVNIRDQTINQNQAAPPIRLIKRSPDYATIERLPTLRSPPAEGKVLRVVYIVMLTAGCTTQQRKTPEGAIGSRGRLLCGEPQLRRCLSSRKGDHCTTYATDKGMDHWAE